MVAKSASASRVKFHCIVSQTVRRIILSQPTVATASCYTKSQHCGELYIKGPIPMIRNWRENEESPLYNIHGSIFNNFVNYISSLCNCLLRFPGWNNVHTCYRI